MVLRSPKSPHITASRPWQHYRNLLTYRCPASGAEYVRDEDIVWLDISMDKRSFMQVGHPSCYFKQHLANLIDARYLSRNALIYFGLGCTLLGHATQQLSAQLLSKGFSFHELHDKVEILRIVCRAKTLDKVRMCAKLLDFMLLDGFINEALIGFSEGGSLEAIEEGSRLMVSEEDAGLFGLAYLFD